MIEKPSSSYLERTENLRIPWIVVFVHWPRDSNLKNEFVHYDQGYTG